METPAPHPWEPEPDPHDGFGPGPVRAGQPPAAPQPGPPPFPGPPPSPAEPGGLGSPRASENDTFRPEVVPLEVPPPAGAPPERPGERRCPHCAEWIPQRERLCRFCGELTVRPEPVVGSTPQGQGPRPRRVVWLLLAFILWVYFGPLDGSPTREVSTRSLDALGLLHSKVFASFEQEWWRLIHATFLHHSPFLLLISGFLVWRLAGELERRADGGLVLFLCVIGGAAINALRVAVEPASSLTLLAGAWPVGIALGGCGVIVVPREGGRAAQVLPMLVFETVLLLAVAAYTEQLGLGLGITIGCAFGLGVMVGLVWPSGPEQRPAGCLCLGLVAFVALIAEWGRHWEPTPAAPPWESTPVESVPEELEDRAIPRLRVAIRLPGGWQDQTRPREEGGSRYQAHFVAGGMHFSLPRQVFVWSVPRGPFDAPDTMASRLIAEWSRPDSWLKHPQLLEERGFPGGELGEGYLLCVRGELHGSSVLLRIYMFVGKDRTVRLDTLAPDSGNPLEEEEHAAFFDAVAGSLRVLKEEPPATEEKDGGGDGR